MTGRGAWVLGGVLGALLIGACAVAWVTSGDRPGAELPALPAQGAGDSIVALTTYAAAHPRSDAVRSTLQRHFDAINGRNYAAWRETVVQERVDALPEEEWLTQYGTTRDGSARIDRIDDLAGGGMLVRVRFISTQDIANAPPGVAAERTCWRNTLPLDGTPPKIGLTGGGSSLPEAC